MSRACVPRKDKGGSTLLLRVENLHKRYGAKVALAGVDLQVATGEIVVVMGPSGCGKSTLVRCLNRLTEPDEGRIFFAGREVTHLPPERLRLARKEIGFVFQHFNLVSHLTAEENVLLALLLSEVPPEVAVARAQAALRQVGLGPEHWRQYPDQLSGGQQQRVGIARALALAPKLMLWDEPTASLDPIIVGEVLEVMTRLATSSRTTMVIVTHEVGFALEVADRIILMEAGRVVEEGAPSVIFTTPRSLVGQKYRELLTRGHWARAARLAEGAKVRG